MENNYFAFPKMEKNAMTTDLFERIFFTDLERRRLVLNVPIGPIYEVATADTVLDVSDIIHHIVEFNRLDDLAEQEAKQNGTIFERQPIRLIVNSPGGSQYEGFPLVHVIGLSRTKVITINVGISFSMASYILIAGHERLLLPGSVVLIHEGYFESSNSTGKAIDDARFQEEYEERIIKPFILARTKITPDQYKENYRKEWYMLPEKALELGVADRIVTDISELY